MINNDSYDAEKLYDANYTIGVICSVFLREFGEAASGIISKICYERGLALGSRLGSGIQEKSFEAAVQAFVKASESSKYPAVLSFLTNEKAILHGTKCPLGLKGRGRAICEAMMTMDQGILERASDLKLDFIVNKTIAQGDENCEVIFEVSD